MDETVMDEYMSPNAQREADRLAQIECMTNATLRANIKLYNGNCETVADYMQYTRYLEEWIRRLTQ